MTSDLDLEQEIDEIRIFDELRVQARELQRRGIDGLCSEKVTGRVGWYDVGDLVEVALLVKVLHSESNKPNWVDGRIAELRKLTWEDLVKSEPTVNTTDDHVPLLRACCILEALSSVSGEMLSDGALSSYYYILHELNFMAGPSDILGGASAGTPGVRQTACMTWWCVRAVQAFAEALENATTFLTALAKFEKTKKGREIPNSWWEVHFDSRKVETAVTLERFRKAFLTSIATDAAPVDPLSLLNGELKKDVKAALKAGGGTLAKLHDERVAPQKRDPESDTWLRATRDFANQIARQHLEVLEGQLLKASEGNDFSTIAKALAKAGKSVRASVGQTLHYLRSVLDGEIASGHVQPERIGDTAELVFAADGLGRLDPRAKDSMIAALGQAVHTVTNEGRVPSHRPFDVLPKGYVLHVAAVEVIRVFTDLIRRSDYGAAADIANRFLNHLKHTWRGEELKGWRHERDHEEAKCQWWLSALAVEALESLGCMLDHRVNQMVLKHLTVRRTEQLKLSLADMFYPDVALVHAGLRERSVSQDLQRMRAHIYGVSPLGYSPVYAVILHGPPGTGKTTLAEALALSAEVELVEVTPSDIVKGGAEMAETRARVVFEALSMLTGVVILLDEFDSILWHRDEEAQPKSIFQFLTPGMLPKLKILNESAKRQRLALILSTNMIGALDEAATREGRFDEKIGIFPPDALSRLGRLAHEIDGLGAPSAKWQDRLNAVVRETGGLAISRLAKAGWFTAPRDRRVEEGTPFGHILKNFDRPNWPGLEKGAPQRPTRRPRESSEKTDTPNPSIDDIWKESTPMAVREWIEWKWVAWLDKKIAAGLPVGAAIAEWKAKGLPERPWRLLGRERKSALDSWNLEFDKQGSQQGKESGTTE